DRSLAQGEIRIGKRAWRLRHAARSLIDEGDSRPGVRVAITHASPAAAIEVEVHLADEEPAAAEDALDVSHMAAAASALHSRGEDRCGASRGRASGRDATRARRRGPAGGVAEEAAILTPIPGVPGTCAEGAAIGVAAEVAHRPGMVARRRRPLAHAAGGRATAGEANGGRAAGTTPT